MKKSLLIFLLLVSATAFGLEHTVKIEGMKFVPGKLEVNVGDTIVWVNKDFVPHTATAIDKTFDSKNILADKSWKYTATKAGKFPYKCIFHKPMFGELTVKEN